MTGFRDMARKHKKIILILVTIGILLTGLVIYLYLPAISDAGSSNGYKCSRAHIYIPRRLDYFGCKTVTGIVKRVKIEPDGDAHILLDLDEKYKVLLSEQNYKKQSGYMVVEDTCHGNPKDILAKLICRHYVSPLPNPEIDKRYEITGNYVIDDWHGSWAEIHGLVELKQLN